MSPNEIPPSFALFRMVTGYYVSRAIYVVAKLGIADHLRDGPRRVNELAEATGTHAPSLKRVLRLLASAGLFTEEADGAFALIPIGASLRADAPGSMRAAALLFGGDHAAGMGRPPAQCRDRRTSFPPRLRHGTRSTTWLETLTRPRISMLPWLISPSTSPRRWWPLTTSRHFAASSMLVAATVHSSPAS